MTHADPDGSLGPAPSDLPALIDTEAGVAAVIEELAAVDVVGFDLEFLSQERYVPDLCLLQLAWRGASGIEVRLVDSLAVDARPVLALLADGRRTVVAHAARQDAGLLAARFDLTITRLFDTQIAAAFVGLGDQLGLGRLTAALVGVELDKDSQWTDWAKRPLSPRQLRYAVADVHHLPALHAELDARLQARGRLAWVEAEGAAVVADGRAAAAIDPADAWRGVGGVRGLDRDGMAALAALAAWRLRRAIADNRPLGQVLPDKVLVELARARPSAERALHDVRGMTSGLRRQGAALIEAIATADAEGSAAATPWQPPPARVQLWTEVVLAMVARIAEDESIPPRFLAARAGAEALARAFDRGDDPSDHPLLRGWRRELLGEAVLEWFRGGAPLRADTHSSSGVTFDRPSSPAQRG